MKVIDLLNKIANGEVPEKIKYNDNTYTLYLDEENNHYYQNDKCKYFMLGFSCLEQLNEEVEIIEDTSKEDKRIEKFYFSVYQDQKLGGRAVVEPLETKINEIIDKINGDEENEN